MASATRVPLLDARLVLTEQLTENERAELAGSSIPVIRIDPGPLHLEQVLEQNRAFGATVFEGLIMSSLRVGVQTGIHLLGPGDLIVPRSELWPSWLADLDFRTAGPVQLGLLGSDLLAAVDRWPRLLLGLYASMGDQLQRLTVQLVICQLSRVEDRIMAMLWLLADSWGHVTPAGVRLPLPLTHETLGALVGARRPTVTLALRKLSDEGALISQDHGWLLVSPPPELAEPAHRIAPASVPSLPVGTCANLPGQQEEEERRIAYAELRDTVNRPFSHGPTVRRTRPSSITRW